MQIKYLQTKQVYDISHSNYFQDPCEKKRKLDLYSKLISEGCCQKTSLEAIGISKATYFRWQKRYRENGIEGLESKSRCPNNLRTPTWSKEAEQLVIATRKKYKLWGKYKITKIIEKNHGIIFSVSMVGRIISKHLKKENIRRVEFYFGKIRPTKHRSFNDHAKRWKYGMKAEVPGQLIQIDHMTVKLINGYSVKHFKAICPVTKIVSEQVYTTATSKIGKRFLDHIKNDFPFKIRSIQVDGGSEFMGEFEQGCKNSSIPLFVLPPRRPKYNSTVERGHCTVKYEFYWQYNGRGELHHIRDKLKEYTEFYNKIRPHQRLQYLTPMEYYGYWRSKESHMY
jgi:transposase